jgi:hypothetical protein
VARFRGRSRTASKVRRPIDAPNRCQVTTNVHCCDIGQEPSASSVPIGLRSQLRTWRPSAGNLARKADSCAASTSVCPVVRQDHPCPDGDDVDELGLQLDDEQDPAGGMPREDVDDPSFAVDRERNLRFSHPVAMVREYLRHHLVHRCVTGTDETAEISALPAHRRVVSGVDGGCDTSDHSEGHHVEPSVLDASDHRPPHAGLGSQVFLSPVLAHSDRAQGDPDLLVIHAISVPTAAWLALP